MTLFSLKSKRKKKNPIEIYTVTDKCNALQKSIDLLTNGHIFKKSTIQRLMKKGKNSKYDVK